jgi:Protein of unknown function (DUF2750)
VTWDVNDQELEAVLHQSADKQYGYFVGKTADWGEVWLVRRGETEYGQMQGDGENGDGGGEVAVWPHERYVAACRDAGLFEDYEPVTMEIHEFVDGMLASLVEDGIGVAVLPMPDGRYTPVPARRLRSDLDAELGRLE